LITSFPIDIYDLIISNFAFPFGKGMEIFEIEIEKVFISFSFYHDDLIHKKYFGHVFKFQKVDETGFIF